MARHPCLLGKLLYVCALQREFVRNLDMTIQTQLRPAVYQVLRRYRNEGKIYRLRRDLATDNEIVLVHQMGRAASMTITNTLRALNIGVPVYHTHWLNPETVADREQRNKRQGFWNSSVNVRVSSLVAAELRKEHGKRRWKVISVARDPIARNISAFFLSIDRFIKGFNQRFDDGELSMDDIQRKFLSDYPHQIPLTWFDKEVRQVFHIDVYAHPFDKHRGYKIIEAGNVKILVIKLERLRECHQEAFQALFGARALALSETHITDRDPSRHMYRNFVDEVVLPASYVDQMYESQYVQHFYSAPEIEEFRRKWLKPDQ